MKQKIPFKHFLLLPILLAASLPAFSQHFDWVKTFVGQDVNHRRSNEIVGSVVDSEGNLYILGHFGPSADMDGMNLLPVTTTKRSVLIAKISTQGELLWHKCINNRLNDDYGHDIRMVGDSAIMVMVSFNLPYWNSSADFDRLYYLDTLLTEDNGYLVNTDSIGSYTVNGFITFNFSGDVLEQYFLQVTLLDNDGHVFPSSEYHPERADTRILSNELFNIDNEGNIYVCRSASDREQWTCDTCPNGFVEYSVENGGVSGLRILVSGTDKDGTQKLNLYPNKQQYGWGQLIIVFSPHFERIINHLYLFDSIEGNPSVRPRIALNSIDIYNNSIFLTLDGAYMSEGGIQSRLRLNNANGLYWESSVLSSSEGCVMSMDTAMHPLFVKKLNCTSDPTHWSKVYAMNAVSFDMATNTFFVLGTVTRDPTFNITEGVYITYDGDTLDLRNNLYWLRMDMDDGSLVSYGKVGSTYDTRTLADNRGSIVSNNNRVITQFFSQYNYIFQDSIITGSSNYAIGCMVWDYEGHEIQYIDYNGGSREDRLNMVKLADSALYLGGTLYNGATFGNYTINPSVNSTAYLAKYVDTSFMTPYVYTDPRVEQAIEWGQDLSFSLTDSPVTLTATATSGLPVSYRCADTSVARINGNTLLLLSNGTTTVTAYQNGNEYGYYPATPVTKTLTVGNVGISTVEAEPQVKAYPNPTRGSVTIDLGNLPPIQPIVRDSSDIQVTLSDEAGAFVKYGNPFRQRVNIQVESGELKVESGVATAWLTDMQGRREEVTLTPVGNGKYTLDLTSRPQSTYLLTLTTADGKTHTLRLLKQSDIFER